MSYGFTREALNKASWEGGHGGGLALTQAMANGVAINPTLLLEAMVKDGMLMESRGGPCWYRVIPPEPPHVHEWHALGVNTSAGTVVLQCTGCTERRSASAKLPIEIPNVGE